MTAVRVGFAGTPPFSVRALRALLASPQSFEVCGVLTAPDRRAGERLFRLPRLPRPRAQPATPAALLLARRRR